MLRDEEIKVRVPGSIKAAYKHIAEGRFTSESEIVREALIAYLAARGITGDQLRETPTPYKVNSPASAPAPAADIPGNPPRTEEELLAMLNPFAAAARKKQSRQSPAARHPEAPAAVPPKDL